MSNLNSEIKIKDKIPDFFAYMQTFLRIGESISYASHTAQTVQWLMGRRTFYCY